jgi:hypothetical protein
MSARRKTFWTILKYSTTYQNSKVPAACQTFYRRDKMWSLEFALPYRGLNYEAQSRLHLQCAHQPQYHHLARLAMKARQHVRHWLTRDKNIRDFKTLTSRMHRVINILTSWRVYTEDSVRGTKIQSSFHFFGRDHPIRSLRR